MGKLNIHIIQVVKFYNDGVVQAIVGICAVVRNVRLSHLVMSFL